METLKGVKIVKMPKFTRKNLENSEKFPTTQLKSDFIFPLSIWHPLLDFDMVKKFFTLADDENLISIDFETSEIASSDWTFIFSRPFFPREKKIIVAQSTRIYAEFEWHNRSGEGGGKWKSFGKFFRFLESEENSRRLWKNLR